MDRVTDLNISDLEPLMAPATLTEELPLTPRQHSFVSAARQSLRNILDEADPRMVLIVGPCSVHDTTAALEYATKLKTLADRVADQFLVLMRVHFEKPRTTVGWKGLLYDPTMDGSGDIAAGLVRTRRFLLDILDIGLPTATEILDPACALYFGDCICWAQIGARTSASQIHRQMGSMLPMPTGFKNTTDGAINVAINAVIAASHPHTFMGLNPAGQLSKITSAGNPYGHIILRGGATATNYGENVVQNAAELLEEHQLCRKLVVDCSHDNCRRDHQRQIEVFDHVIQQVSEGEGSIFGAIIESYLKAGKQRHDGHKTKVCPSTSVTDPCIDWKTTEEIILRAYEKLTVADQEAVACP